MTYEQAKEIIKLFDSGYKRSEHGKLLTSLLKKEARLAEYEIAQVLLVLRQICHHCWNNYVPCDCSMNIFKGEE